MIAAAIAVSAWPLSAQKFNCSQAASLLLSDSGARLDLFSATNTFLTFRCHGSAVAVVTKLLRQARLDTVRDTLGYMVAYYLREQGMADSVGALVTDSTQSAEKRTSFMKLLTIYADCRAGVDDRPGWESRWTVLGGSGSGCPTFLVQPLSAAVRDRARERIAWMGAHDPDPRLRELSRRVAEELARRSQYANPFEQ